MDNNNVDDNGNHFLDNARYVIDEIDDNIDNANNEVDVQIIIIGGWIGVGPYATNNTWVLETLGGLEQWVHPQTCGKLAGTVQYAQRRLHSILYKQPCCD